MEPSESPVNRSDRTFVALVLLVSSDCVRATGEAMVERGDSKLRAEKNANSRVC